MPLTHDHRLITYGTLAPGQVNHGQLSHLDGTWSKGTIRGRLMDEGWGAELGCPGIVIDPQGDAVDVHIFESVDLPDLWPHLDEFEGEGYRRVVVQVETDSGSLDGQLYELATNKT